MRKLSIVLVSAMIVLATACQNSGVTVNITVKDKRIDSVGVFVASIDTMIPVDEQGKATVTLPIKEAQYGMLQYKFKRSVTYFEPGQNFNVTWDMTPSELTIAFEGGNADKNNFINSKEMQGPVMGDFGRAEDELLEQLNEYQVEAFKVLEGKGFEKAFEEKEKLRVEYWIYGMLCQYAAGKECSDATYDKLKSLIREDKWLTQISEYTNYMAGAVSLLANQGKGSDLSYDVRIENAMKYVIDNIKSQEIKDYLLGMYAVAFIQEVGVNSAANVKEMVEKNVVDPEVLAMFAQTYAGGESLAAGVPSPDFKMTSIDGKEYTLADFKGRVLYIDIWATWCAPCQEELPMLKELEEMFKGTNVTFVSMSIDKDKAAWEKQVKGDKLGGVQLYAGPDSEFCDAYKVSGIPRFIMIDKEGKIVEANMSRPSDEKTIERLGMMAEGLEE